MATPADAVDLVADDHDGDQESALGGDKSSYSQSLKSSVLDYKYQNGRRYSAFRPDRYFMPNDETEMDRMDLLAHCYRLMLGGELVKFKDRIVSPQRVLDIGTGTGLWAIEFADEYPESVVIGTDLSPIQQTWIPPNCHFYVDDAEAPWTFQKHERFDFIHGRQLEGSFAAWPVFYEQALRHLKPGGVIEMQGHLMGYKSLGKSVPVSITDTVDMALELAEKNGRPLQVASKHKEYMEEAGFVDVEEYRLQVPLGSWAKGEASKQLGLFWQLASIESVEPYLLYLLTNVKGLTQTEAMIQIELTKADYRKATDHHLYSDVFFVSGRKQETHE